jgi:hypothetical protein
MFLEGFFPMLTLRRDFGCQAMRESASAAAYLRSQGHLAFAKLPGRPSTNSDWSAPGS